jgi:AraC-like DNA-binding protein
MSASTTGRMRFRIAPLETEMQMKNIEIETAGPVNGQRAGCRTEKLGQSDDFGDGLFGNAERIEQSIEYMRQHLDQPLQVARLAALVNISPSHFFALFKRQIGCAPIDFFIRLRMDQACELLDGTLLNVKEVAAALGYDDPFYFSRTFKAVNHVAPSEYRLLPREFKDAIRSATLPRANSGRQDSSGDLRTTRWPTPASGRPAVRAKGRVAAADTVPQLLANAVH